MGAGIRFLSKPVAAATLAETIRQALQDTCLADPDDYLPPLPHRDGKTVSDD